MPGQPVYPILPFVDAVLKDGSKNVASAGTPVKLSSSSVACIEVLIQANRNNAGYIYVGGSTVPNDGSSGILIGPPVAGQTPPSVPISANNLEQVYINSDNDGEGVTFIYW